MSQNPIVEWPEDLYDLLEGMQVITTDDKRYCRIDADVDATTLFLLNDFEARARHRQVRIRLAGGIKCLVGDIDGLVGLGVGSDPTRHIGKVRVGFPATTFRMIIALMRHRSSGHWNARESTTGPRKKLCSGAAF